jgi:hypothetical protein
MVLGFEGKFQNILFNQLWHHQSCGYGVLTVLLHVRGYQSTELKLNLLLCDVVF